MLRQVGDCFVSIDTARNLGPGLIQVETQLAVARLRYSKWLNTVRIADVATGDSRSRVQVASPEQAKVVKSLLGGIEVAFWKAKHWTSKYLAGEASTPTSGTNSVSIENRDELVTSIIERGHWREK